MPESWTDKLEALKEGLFNAHEADHGFVFPDARGDGPHAQASSSRAKLGWARENIDKIEVLIVDYVGSDPVSIAADLDASEDTVAYMDFRLQCDPPPAEIALRTGNVLNDLRAALDHIHKAAVPHLVCMKKGVEVRTHLGEVKVFHPSFPIPPAHSDRSPWKVQLRPTNTQCTYPPHILEFLEDLYDGVTHQTWPKHLFSKLGTLVNADKHKLVVAVSSTASIAVVGSVVHQGGTTPTSFLLPNRETGAFETRFKLNAAVKSLATAEMAQRTLVKLRGKAGRGHSIDPRVMALAETAVASFSDPVVEVEFDAAAKVVLDGYPDGEVVSDLTQIADAVEEVIGKYETFLGI